jgi:hypothetical protein
LKVYTISGDPLVIQVEQELMVQALDVLLGLDNRLEVLILNWD